MKRWKRIASVLIVAALFAAGCGDDTTDADPPSASTTSVSDSTPDPVDSTEPDPDQVDTTDPDAIVSVDERGVTDEEIALGVAVLEFPEVLGLDWGNQQEIWDIMIQDVNAKGGVHGRQLVPTYANYSPIDLATADTACVELTEDAELFAVLGGFTGLVSDANTCFALAGVAQFGVSPQPDVAPDVPWVAAEADENRRMALWANYLIEEGILDGKTFAIVAFSPRISDVEENLLPVLADAGLEPADQFYTDFTGGDSTALDAEMSIWAERMRANGIEHLFLVDDALALIGDLEAAGYSGEASSDWSIGLTTEEADNGADLNGTLSMSPISDRDAWNTPKVQECRDIVEAARPDLAPIATPGDTTTDDVQWERTVLWVCRYVDLFVVTMEAASAPTHEAILEAVTTNMSSFSFAENEFASFGPGKFDANDGFVVTEWDTAAGDWVPITELRNLR
jgi:ABC-type branched-subunit amino acid transport system substrate-binding protein